MKSKPITYRVDVLTTIGTWACYTALKGTDKAMADSLANGLKRQGAAGRMVELPSGVVLEEWGTNLKVS